MLAPKDNLETMLLYYTKQGRYLVPITHNMHMHNTMNSGYRSMLYIVLLIPSFSHFDSEKSKIALLHKMPKSEKGDNSAKRKLNFAKVNQVIYTLDRTWAKYHYPS